MFFSQAFLNDAGSVYLLSLHPRDPELVAFGQVAVCLPCQSYFRRRRHCEFITRRNAEGWTVAPGVAGILKCKLTRLESHVHLAEGRVVRSPTCVVKRSRERRCRGGRPRQGAGRIRHQAEGGRRKEREDQDGQGRGRPSIGFGSSRRFRKT